MTDAAIDLPASSDRKFFRNVITVMAVILLSGFVVQLAMGRSSFSAPLIVHAHAIAFMGWVFITLTQTWLGASGNIALHRQLGRIAAVWVIALLVLGLGGYIASAARRAAGAMLREMRSPYAASLETLTEVDGFIAECGQRRAELRKTREFLALDMQPRSGLATRCPSRPVASKRGGDFVRCIGLRRSTHRQPSGYCKCNTPSPLSHVQFPVFWLA